MVAGDIPVAQVPLEIAVSDPDDYVSLLDWFRSDGAIRRIPSTVRSATATDQMGAAEILTIILDSGGFVAVLGAIRTWIKYRQPSVKVKLRSKDGRQIDVDAKNAGDVEEIAKALGLDRD